MYILTFTKKGSDYVEVITNQNKENILSTVYSYFDMFTKSGDNFTRENLLDLIGFILNPDISRTYDIPRKDLGCFSFSFVHVHLGDLV